MDNGYTKQIRERVLSANDGTVFAAADFVDIAGSATVRQSITRLVKENVLRGVMHGVRG